MAELIERIELLKRVRLFSGLADEDLEAVNGLLQEKRFRKGSVIFEEGDEGDALYIVESGRVKVSTKDAEGREKILSVFGEGDYLGEMALLSDQPRSATCTVVGDAEVLMLPKDSFERFVASNLNVMRQFVNLMSRRLAETNVLATREEEQEQRILGKCVALFSPKGGIGKTTVTVNLAVAIRELTQKSVVVFDCSYPFGDVGVMLNVDPKRTIIDLLPHVNELGGEIIESILQTHASGVKVLLAPPTPEETELVTAEHVSIIISALRELYEFVIVDTHSSFTDISIGVLDAADLILVLTALELPALKNVHQFMDTAVQKLGYPLEKMAVVVNRASPVGGLAVADVETSVGTKVVSVISSAGAVAVAAANQGVPFVISNRESQIYRDILTLVRLIVPRTLFVGEEPELPELEGEAAASLPTKILTAPSRLRAGITEGVGNLKINDVLFGLGGLFAVSAPFMLIFALIGFILPDSVSGFLFNLSLWIGIVGGTLWITHRQENPRSPWVLGAILGGMYGLAMNFAAVVVANILGGTPNMALLILSFVPGAVLGMVGAFIGEMTRPQAQALLS